MRTRITGIMTSLLMAVMLAGCATQANRDPLEGLNRGIYKFNDVADKAVIKPVAGAYKAVLPSPVRSGVNNFFTNLGTFVTMINDLLQFKFSKAADDAGRFVINTTFGIVGVVDVASMDNVPKHNEDFGQTLGYWGVGNGAYLVLPILGPSTLRDTGGIVVDTAFFDPLGYVDDVSARNSAYVLELIDKRSQYLPASDLLDEAALDPYVFMRDAYLQRRENQVNDGTVVKKDNSYYDETEPDGSSEQEEAPADAPAAEPTE
ncbi:MAG TPA: VacJ family lipoprotein [Methylophilaceae bacterium]|nr:VacJ family lipoprotein [Methylophilaceae bacterium]